MAERQLEIELLLKDKEALSRLKTAIGNINKETGGLSKSSVASFAAMAAAIGGAFVAAQSLARFMSSSIAAASQQEDAINRLNFALKNQGTFTSAVSQAYQDMANQFQVSTRFSDDAVNQIQQTLVTIGNVGPQQMQRVTQATLDFATATGRDASTAADLLAKAAAGNTSALSRYGIILDESIPKSRRFEEVLKLIEQRMGGSAQADVRTYSGSVAQLKNAWGELLEKVGDIIVKNPNVVAGINDVTKVVQKLTGFVEENAHVIPEFFGIVPELTDIARISVEEVTVAFLAGIERMKATGWQGLQNFLISGPAGFGGAMTQDVSSPIADQLDAQLMELMAKKDELIAQVEASGPSLGTKLLAPDPVGIQESVDQSTSILTEAMTQLQIANQGFVDGFKHGFGQIDTSMQGFFTSFGKGMGAATKQATSMMADTFTQVLMGQKKADEAFKQLGMSLISLFAKMAIEIALQQALALAAQAVIGAGVKAFGVAAAAALYPAAALASLASFGANAAPASAGMVATAATAAGIAALSKTAGLAQGGTTLRPGDFIVGEAGPEMLRLPRGSEVRPLDSGGSGPLIINIEINNPVISNGEIAEEFARLIAEKVSEFIDLETRRL